MGRNNGISIRLMRLAAGSVIAAMLAAGCNNKKPVNPYANMTDAGPMPTMVSSDATGDSRAFRASENQLEPAQWNKIQDKGPKPMLGNAAEPSKPTGDVSTQELKTSSPPPARKKPSTQPIDESELPMQSVTLPDGKARIIWTLRSYGGSVVSSTRDGGTSRRTLTVTPGDLAPLVAVLTTHLGATGTVLPLAKENTLVITCDPAMRDSTVQLLSQIDVPPRQVEISAKIFEVSHDFDFQMGAELIMNRVASDGAQSAESLFSTKRFLDSQLPGAQPYTGSVVSLMQVMESAGISFEASFQILADSGLITVVSSPRITVAAGGTGYMLAGQELPIQATYIINGVLQTSTTYKPVGAQLYITPQSMSENQVKLHTICIVSAVSGFSPLPTLTGNNPANMLINPIIESREAETAVTVDNGNTLVISGLKMMRTTTRENKIPGLGDLPVLGWMFKNHRSQQHMTDLYFFVTPTML
jgi:type II secretory pathway component GspD/PulD (secretin)